MPLGQQIRHQHPRKADQTAPDHRQEKRAFARVNKQPDPCRWRQGKHRHSDDQPAYGKEIGRCAPNQGADSSSQGQGF